MNLRSLRLTIIIPTKNRLRALAQLLDSMSGLDGLDRLCPEIIVADNNSRDDTYQYVESRARDFPPTFRALKAPRPGKSAAINDAAKMASGNVLAFLDDDVVVDQTWLTAVEDFFLRGKHQVGQGSVRLQCPGEQDSAIQKLVQRYRTIPRVEYGVGVKRLHSLNGANFFVRRERFEQAGGFDERLGPGASGTSEDVDLARRLTRLGMTIGYAPNAIVYHHVDSSRLTEEYFKQTHWRQGASRFLMRKRSTAEIVFNLVRVSSQYTFYTLVGKERERYRNKGRIYHYLGMLDAKRNQPEPRPARQMTRV